MPRIFRLIAFAAVSLALLPWGAYADGLSSCPRNTSSTATLVLPASISNAVGPANDPLAGGSTPDSIAVFTPDGTCVGVTAWNASNGTILSVSGRDRFFRKGFEPSDSLRIRLYDASRDAVDHALVKYAECSSVKQSLQPLCRSDGKYQKNAVYVVEALGSYTRTLQMRGSASKDGEDAGWRFLGVPTASAITAEELRLGEQSPDFNLPEGHMLMEWNDQAPSTSGPTGAYKGLSPTDKLRPGRGYAVYLFDEPPYALDPTITIGITGKRRLQAADPVTVNNLAQTARWHLLANPYPSGYDLSELTDLAASGFQNTVQRYDASTGTWVPVDQSTAEISGWEAFFIERTDFSGGQGATSLTFDPEGRIIGVPFVNQKTQQAPSPVRRHATLGLALHVTGPKGDTLSQDQAAQLVFDEQASKAWDPFDASKLRPLNSSYALLPVFGNGRDGSRKAKAVESRSWPSTLQTIPLGLRTHGLEAKSATISVRKWSLPDAWHARLVDTVTGRTFSLNARATHTVSVRTGSDREAPRFKLQIAPSGGTFPLQLSTFEAALENEAVQLQWELPAKEATGAGFYVQRRSVDDTSDTSTPNRWTKVGFVGGSETTRQSQTYTFEDTDLPYEAAQFSYRLRRVDAEGTVYTSEEISVKRSQIEQTHLHGSFPNPVRQQATIRYELPSAQRIRVELYDMLGRRVQALVNARREAGRHQVTLDASRLPSGTYFYRLSTGTTTKTKKLTVVH